MTEQAIVATVVALAGLWAARRAYRSLRPTQAASVCGTGCGQPCACAPAQDAQTPCPKSEEESADRGSY